VQKLESGVLDLSVRDLLNKDVPGILQLVEVCSVHSLCLAHNGLTHLSLPMPLQIIYLDISHNQLETLQGRGLESLLHLRTLLASHNKLETMVGLDHNLLLNTIDLSHNDIAEAEPLPAHAKLYELNLSFNCIDDMDNVRTMALSHMQVLHLRGNPLAFAGSNYRLTVSHMLPSVRVLDDIMQSPSPYVNLDAMSNSPARRDEAHTRATGHIFGDSNQSRGRAHWSRKPNVVVKSKKSSLSYSTIHARKVAAAGANNVVAAAAGGADAASSTVNNVTTPNKTGAATGAPRGSSQGSSQGNHSQGNHSQGNHSPSSSRQPRRTSPTKNQIARDPPSSIAMQMTKHHIQRVNNRSGRTSPKVVINMPRLSAERADDRRSSGTKKPYSQQRLRAVRSKVDSHMSPVVMRKTKGHLHDVVHDYAEQEDHHKTVHNTEYPVHRRGDHENRGDSEEEETIEDYSRESRSGRATTYGSSSKRTSHQKKKTGEKGSGGGKSGGRGRGSSGSGGFGRLGSFSKNDVDKQSLSQALTPKTLAFASDLRSGSKTTPLRSGGRGNGSRSRSGSKTTTTSSSSSMKKRAQQKQHPRNAAVRSSGLRIETGVAYEQEVQHEQEQQQEQQQQQQHRDLSRGRPMTYQELDEKVHDNEGDQDLELLVETTVVNTKQQEHEKEWNTILQALIAQKKESLALLYQSLANESESQTRMVNSSNTIEQQERVRDNKTVGGGTASRIHIDRGGNVTSYT